MQECLFDADPNSDDDWNFSHLVCDKQAEYKYVGIFVYQYREPKEV
jgi:hypothetical protein